MPTQQQRDAHPFGGEADAYVAKLTPAPVAPQGDVNGDGRPDIRDVLLSRQAVVGLRTLTPEETARADVVADGKLTVVDVPRLLQMAAGLG